MIAVILSSDNKILGVIMADPKVDSLPEGYPEGSRLVEAPEGCDDTWTYDPASGFKAPDQFAAARKNTKVEF